LPIPRIVLAGTHSGVGKTTIASGLMLAYKNRGLRVQGYKVGPDYIDPGYHQLATGIPSRNLDLKLTPREVLRELFTRSATKADLAVIEGVMGLYDGSGSTTEGSTADVAKTISAPVILVVDAKAMAASCAAMVKGFAAMDPKLNLAGVILNRVGSDTHAELLREAIKNYTGLPVLGTVGASPLTLPERHLGLLPTWENREAKAIVEAAAGMVKELDLEEILRIAYNAPAIIQNTSFFPREPVHRVPIGLALDQAFNFYYQDGLEYLEALGAELVPFSPLSSTCLPKGIGGLIVGGGFPEMFPQELSDNRPLLTEIKKAYSAGLPIYAECGGYMYLAEELMDLDGKCFPMVGLFPGKATMQPRLSGLGYRQGITLRDSPLGPAGTLLCGHEFHYSTMTPSPQPFLKLKGRGKETFDGYASSTIAASYLHTHWAGIDKPARSFLRACYKFSKGHYNNS